MQKLVLIALISLACLANSGTIAYCLSCLTSQLPSRWLSVYTTQHDRLLRLVTFGWIIFNEFVEIFRIFIVGDQFSDILILANQLS